MPIAIAVAHRQELVYLGIAKLLGAEKDFTLTERISDIEGAMKCMTSPHADVMVLSADLLAEKAWDAHESNPARKAKPFLIVVARELSEEEFLRAIRLGVRGIYLEEMPASSLLKCLRAVHAGKEFIEKDMFLRAFSRLLRHSSAHRKFTEALTTREYQVMESAVAGMSNKQIAAKLKITDGTVKIHLHRAYAKLNVKNRMELLIYAQKQGLL